MGTNSISSNVCLTGVNETVCSNGANEPVSRPRPNVEFIPNSSAYSTFNPFPQASVISEHRYANGTIVRIFGEAPQSFDDYLNPPAATSPRVARHSLASTNLASSHNFEISQAGFGGEVLVLLWLAALVGGRPVEGRGRIVEGESLPRELQPLLAEFQRLRAQGANTSTWVAHLRAEIEVLNGRIASLGGAHSLEVATATRRLEQAQARYEAARDLRQQTLLEQQGSKTQVEQDFDRANRRLSENRDDPAAQQAFSEALARRTEYLSRGLTPSLRHEAASRAYESALSEMRAAEQALPELQASNRNAGAYDARAFEEGVRNLETRIRFLETVQRALEADPAAGQVPDLSQLLKELGKMKEIRIDISESVSQVIYSSQSDARSARFPTSEVRLRALNQEIPIHERVLGDATQRLQRLQGQAENFLAAEARRSTESLRERLETANAEIRRLDGEVTAAEAEIRGQRVPDLSDLSQRRAERQGFRDEVRTLEGQIRDRQAQLVQFQQEAREIEARFRHGSNANSRPRSAEGLSASLADAEVALSAARASLDSLHFERGALQLIHNLQRLNANAFDSMLAGD